MTDPSASNPALRLTDREQRFVDEYMVDLKAGPAARRAGYSASFANSASRLTRRPHVAAAIEAGLAARARRIRIRADEVLGELARVAFFDPAGLVDETGSPRPLNALDPAVRAGLGAVEIIETQASNRGPAQRRLRARPGEKVRALVALTKHLGVAQPDRQGVEAAVEAAIAQARANPFPDSHAWRQFVSDPATRKTVADIIADAIRQRRTVAKAVAQGADPEKYGRAEDWAWLDPLMDEVVRREDAEITYGRKMIEDFVEMRAQHHRAWLAEHGGMYRRGAG